MYWARNGFQFRAVLAQSAPPCIIVPVEGLLADAHLAAYLANRGPRFGLPQGEGDLLGCVPGLLHGTILLSHNT